MTAAITASTHSGLVTGWHAGADPHGLGLVVGVWMVGALLVCAWWYAAGLRRVLAHPGARRQAWRAAALVTAVLSVALIAGPLGEPLEDRLSTHMTQHLVLIMVAAPLLAVSAPGQVLLAGMPARLRTPVVRGVRRLPLSAVATPHLAWCAAIAALWLWHLPGAYDLALRSDVAHLLEHATFLLTAWLFWWHLARVGRNRLRGAAAAFYVLAAVPPGAALGAVLTFPDHPIYPGQAARAAAAGTDPVLDQHIGGLIMWIPLDFVYLALGIWLFGRWLRRLDAPSAAASGSAPLPTLPVDARPQSLAPAEVAR